MARVGTETVQGSGYRHVWCISSEAYWFEDLFFYLVENPSLLACLFPTVNDMYSV